MNSMPLSQQQRLQFNPYEFAKGGNSRNYGNSTYASSLNQMLKAAELAASPFAAQALQKPSISEEKPKEPQPFEEGNASQLLRILLELIECLIALLTSQKEEKPLNSTPTSEQNQRSIMIPMAASSSATAPGGNSSPPGNSTSSGQLPQEGSEKTDPSTEGGDKKTAPTRANEAPSADNPTLQQTLDKIAQDPEGAKLLKEAMKRGVKITVGTPEPGTLGQYSPGENKIVIGRPDDVRTLVHELVHATTPEDGDSRDEEGKANIIADRISSRINKRSPGNPHSIYNNTTVRYPELPRFNGNFDNNINRILKAQDMVA